MEMINNKQFFFIINKVCSLIMWFFIFFLSLIYISFSEEIIINLKNGWNLVSIPLKEGYKVKSSDCESFLIFSLEKPQLPKETEKKIYVFMINVEENCKIKFEGEEMEWILCLKKGWNVFQIIGEAGKLEAGNCKVIDIYVFENVEKMEVGKGYWIYSDKECKIILEGEIATEVNLNLKKGVNLFSLPFPTSFEVFSRILKKECQADLEGIYEYDASEKLWKFSSNIEPTKGYYLLINKDCSIKLDLNKIREEESRLKDAKKIIVKILDTKDNYSRYLGIAINKKLGNNWWISGEYTCNYLVLPGISAEYTCIIEEEFKSAEVSVSSIKDFTWKIEVTYPDGKSYSCEVYRETRCPSEE